jgi:DNA-binding transcriptional regulator YdaS (Cro superfamily)
MSLKPYLLGMKIPERDAFAKRCGTSRQHLTNIAYGQKPCGEKLAIAIERESNGAVRCEVLRPDVDWAYLRQSSCACEQKAAA